MTKQPLRSAFTEFGRIARFLIRMRPGRGSPFPPLLAGAYIPDSSVPSIKEGGRYIFIPSFFLESPFASPSVWETTLMPPYTSGLGGADTAPGPAVRVPGCCASDGGTPGGRGGVDVPAAGMGGGSGTGRRPLSFAVSPDRPLPEPELGRGRDGASGVSFVSWTALSCFWRSSIWVFMSSITFVDSL